MSNTSIKSKRIKTKTRSENIISNPLVVESDLIINNLNPIITTRLLSPQTPDLLNFSLYEKTLQNLVV